MAELAMDRSDRVSETPAIGTPTSQGGLTTTVIASTVVYALMLPVLRAAPKRLSSTTDGEAAAPA